MLRITIHNDAEVTRLIIEGRLAGEWAKELERCWHQVKARPSSPRILVELRDVRFVDEEGRELLRQMAQAGAELMAVDLVMKAIVEEIAI
jgi:anti-anti-sigma regulatory factor